jgi:hypothetical protein
MLPLRYTATLRPRGVISFLRMKFQTTPQASGTTRES